MSRSVLYPFIFIALFSDRYFSQSSDSLGMRRVVITTSILEYFPTFRLGTGNFNIGSEVYLKNSKSIAVSAGIVRSYGPSYSWLNIVALSTAGVRFQVEGRHYFGWHRIWEPGILLFWPHIFQYKTQRLKNTGYYAALHSSYQYTTTKRPEQVVDYVADNPPFNTVHYKENVYLVNRSAYALNLKFGYQCIKKCGFTVDYSVGFGVQYIQSSARGRIGDDTAWPNQQQEFQGKFFDHGSGIYPKALYQVKLGWAL